MADTDSSTTAKPPIKVLIVDDSPTAREFLVYLFASDHEFRVVGTAANGEDAIAAVKNKKPDVVTMDIHMPRMNGYDATRAIMENYPVPIVIVSGSLSDAEMKFPFSALESGAVAVVRRPEGINHPDHAAAARELIQTVKLMSEVKVVRRWAARKTVVSEPVRHEQFPARAGVKLVAVGSSTGGPLVLQQILSLLPRDFPVPIVVVQHITEGFTEGFTDWLREISGFSVSVAEDGDALEPGHAYIAPNGGHMGVSDRGRISLRKGEPEHGHAPSISYLFRSVADAYGSNAIGVLLTGMGKDGSAELGLLKSKGAVTLAQDKESSVVHGMPGEAIRLGAATYVLPPEKIASALIAIIRQHPT